MSGCEHDRTILVVEDNKDVRHIFSEVFHSLNYQVLEASDGLNAWEILNNATSPVHVILTDLRMPVMDGLELCTRVKNDPRFWAVPVVLLTATSLHNLPQMRKLFSAVLVKPCPFGKLISTLKAVQK